MLSFAPGEVASYATKFTAVSEVLHRRCHTGGVKQAAHYYTTVTFKNMDKFPFLATVFLADLAGSGSGWR